MTIYLNEPEKLAKLRAAKLHSYLKLSAEAICTYKQKNKKFFPLRLGVSEVVDIFIEAMNQVTLQKKLERSRRHSRALALKLLELDVAINVVMETVTSLGINSFEYDAKFPNAHTKRAAVHAGFVLRGIEAVLLKNASPLSCDALQYKRQSLGK